MKKRLLRILRAAARYRKVIAASWSANVPVERSCGACGAPLLLVEDQDGNVVPLDLGSAVRYLVPSEHLGRKPEKAQAHAQRVATWQSHIETCPKRNAEKVRRAND